ncbi:BON domain-containing protein [Sphingomonas sp. NPDC079357]|uniref:BON domain-containing protein n=1 Tax=Sphingomonas sp. NPDC079357 TaxID=3364518 RepID=UPI00384C53C8
MKSDDQLQRDVLAELAWDPRVQHHQIGVSVEAGVVSLTGTVPSFAEKVAAEQAARRVGGFRALAEEIKVHRASDKKWSDEEIAKRICDLFDWDAIVPSNKLSVTVEHGWVTLSGSVDWHYQRDAAWKAAGRIHGVTGISNMVTIRQVPTPADVRDRIVDAFRRHADIDAGSIRVLTDGGKVTLGGIVHAYREREIAERAAWAAPGVTAIDDNIVVA